MRSRRFRVEVAQRCGRIGGLHQANGRYLILNRRPGACLADLTRAPLFRTLALSQCLLPPAASVFWRLPRHEPASFPILARTNRPSERAGFAQEARV
jgi:hypothetical protein